MAKRLRNKDWAGELIGGIWQNLNVHYVFVDDQSFAILEEQAIIPREDIGVYLTAQTGEAQCFVSANYESAEVIRVNSHHLCLLGIRQQTGSSRR